MSSAMIGGKENSPFKYYNLKEMEQYASLKVPSGVIVPTTDEGAWEHFPNERWVYNRLDIAILQGMHAAPVGVAPPSFPIFLKPIINLYGMGVGARKIHSESDYELYKHLSGHFWMDCLEGDHLSHDLVMSKGKVVYSLTFKGHGLGRGMFDYWETVKSNEDTLYVVDWVRRHLDSYTGCINVETLGGKIIECHLRMGDFHAIGDLDLMQNIIDVYAGGKWSFSGTIQKFYEFALWGDQDVQYSIDSAKVREIGEGCEFCEIDKAELNYQNPIGGVRVAIIGGYDFDKCVKARQLLYENFLPRPRKPRTVY